VAGRGEHEGEAASGALRREGARDVRSQVAARVQATQQRAAAAPPAVPLRTAPLPCVFVRKRTCVFVRKRTCVCRAQQRPRGARAEHRRHAREQRPALLRAARRLRAARAARPARRERAAAPQRGLRVALRRVHSQHAPARRRPQRRRARQDATPWG